MNKEECSEVNDVTNKPVNKYTGREKQPLYSPEGSRRLRIPGFKTIGS